MTKIDDDGNGQEFRGKGFCANITEQTCGRAGTSHPSREVGRDSILGEMPEGPGRQTTHPWLHLCKNRAWEGLQSEDELFQGSVANEDKDFGVFCSWDGYQGGTTPPKWTGGRPLVWASGQRFQRLIPQGCPIHLQSVKSGWLNRQRCSLGKPAHPSEVRGCPSKMTLRRQGRD